MILNTIKISRNEKTGILILLILYGVGLAGMLSPYRAIFLPLSALNLFITASLMFWYEKNRGKEFLIFSVIAWLTGFFIEVAGVHTGKIFGVYHYGESLGIKFLNVPLVIGVNWFILVFASAQWIKFLGITNRILAAAIGAALMVTLDLIIEPVAMKLDFWQWNGDVIPLQNYIGWYVIAFFLQCIYFQLHPKGLNVIAWFVMIIQVLFFAVLRFFL